jgi:hypothetical protein
MDCLAAFATKKTLVKSEGLQALAIQAALRIAPAFWRAEALPGLPRRFQLLAMTGWGLSRRFALRF